ncbi:putative DUF444 domain-containing protein YeaH [uncultured Gammaproteobacteria bacterium]
MGMNVIDRRLNPQGKSLGNRQRFLRRAREQVMKAVRDASAKRGIQDLDSGDNIKIPADGIREPAFHRSANTGTREGVLPGNRDYSEGDKIPRGREGQGQGTGGSGGGDGEDEFQFVLTRDEFMDLFLEDLELPDLIKRKVKQSQADALVRAGFSISGTPANLNLVRTMRNSLSRRIALKRPKSEAMALLAQQIQALEDSGLDPDLLAGLRAELERERKRLRLIPYIDPVDVRYNRFTKVPVPVAQAVMFCLMDVSGSMTEPMKDLSKRFFMLLYLFLRRRYLAVDVVFIRHTHEAKEVDEETFFHSRETGGTVVSTALEEMRRIIQERYPAGDWNIYAAQASDGDNLTSDNDISAALLRDVILPICQYFAYIEVSDEHQVYFGPPGRDTDLWRTYRGVAAPNLPLAMRKVRSRQDIYPVFRELFQRSQTAKFAGGQC